MSLGRWVKGACLVVAVVALSFLFDGVVSDAFAKPISSGQTKAALQSMRTWGEGTTILFVTVALVLARPAEWRRPVAVLMAVLVVSIAVSEIKPAFGRLRPDQVATDSSYIPWHVGVGRNSSFPSGHVATAFAFARGLSTMHPALRPLCIAGAAGTAASRMYDQRHYLSDCVAGAVLGWILAAPVMAAAHRLFLIAETWLGTVAARGSLWSSRRPPGMIET